MEGNEKEKKRIITREDLYDQNERILELERRMRSAQDSILDNQVVIADNQSVLDGKLDSLSAHIDELRSQMDRVIRLVEEIRGL